jgi:hypothetical protein
MPTTARLGAPRRTPGGDRTVLFPAHLASAISKDVMPRVGTSGRRQWLVQKQGRGRRPRRIEFPPTVLQITLGRAGACRCQVDLPGVSRLHAVLVRKANRGVYLVDLGSREGTFLNGERVTDEVLLMDGDRISLGNAVTFEFMDGARPAESKVRRWARRVWSTASGHPRLP